MPAPKGAAAKTVEDVSGNEIGDDVWDQESDGGSFLENDDNPDNEVADTEDDDATAQAAEGEDNQAADDEAEQDEEGEAEELAEEVADEDEALDENGQPYQPINPPNNWPQQEQVFFRKLPPVMQHAFINRARAMVADYTTKTQQLAQVRNYYKDVDTLIAPRIKAWQLAGMSTGQALQQLLALSDLASEKPMEFIQYFAQLRGIDLGQVGQNPQGGAAPNGGQVDPQVAALQRQIAQIQSTVSQTVSQQQQREQQARQAQQIAQQRNAEAVINQFASQVGPDGKPLYPFFNQLEGTIATLIQTGQAKSMAQAYEMAAWAHPQVRQQMQARIRRQENEKARKAAEKAKRAAVSVSGASGTGSGRVKTDDMSINALMRAAARGDIT